jgi:hypothetical protein
MTTETRHPAPVHSPPPAGRHSIALGYRRRGRSHRAGAARAQRPAACAEGALPRRRRGVPHAAAASAGRHRRRRPRCSMDISPLRPGAQALITTPGATKWYRSRTAAGSGRKLGRLRCTSLPMPPSNGCRRKASCSTARRRKHRQRRRTGNRRALHRHGPVLPRPHREPRALHARCAAPRHPRDAGMAARCGWNRHASPAIRRCCIHRPGLAGCTGVRHPAVRRLRCRRRTARRLSCRTLCTSGDVGVTRLPGLLVARYRGTCTQAARAWFMHIWSLVRPAMTGRTAQAPRIWAT